jgi:hypothetical protein
MRVLVRPSVVAVPCPHRRYSTDLTATFQVSQCRTGRDGSVARKPNAVVEMVTVPLESMLGCTTTPRAKGDGEREVNPADPRLDESSKSKEHLLSRGRLTGVRKRIWSHFVEVSR